jgi:hypothetical protein
LSELPKEIEATYLELASFEDRITAKDTKLRALVLEKTLEVTTLQGPDGKLLLTNDKQRDGAIAKALAESPEYAEIAEELGNLKQDRLRLQARLERLRMEFRELMIDAEHRNALAALKVADAIYSARHHSYFPIPQQVEAEIDFGF